MKPAATSPRSGCASHSERSGDRHYERDDEHFDVAEAVVLQVENHKHIERREDDAVHQRHAEEQLQRDRGADHFRQIARGNRHFAEHPQHERDRLGVGIAAGLREIAAAGDAEPRGQRLQQDRHQVRQHDHAEERVAVARAAGEIGRPVARVHVADRDEIAGASEGEHLAPEADAVRDGDRSVNFGQAGRAGRCVQGFD
jgi:hypothetical protein